MVDRYRVSRTLWIGAAVACFAAASPGALAGIVFNDRADFLNNAVGPIVIEDFEDEAVVGTPAGGQVGMLTLTDFIATSNPLALKILDQPSAGNMNTTPGGAKYLALDTDIAGVSASVTWFFTTPITELGFNIIDLKTVIVVTINATDYLINGAGDGGVTFWGILDVGEFDTISFNIVEGIDSFYSFDDLVYSIVPTPGAALLLVIAAGSSRRRRRPRPQTG